MKTEALALALFVGAFWSLKRQGLIDIEVIEDPTHRRVFHHHELSLTLLQHRERFGLEGAILTNLEDCATIRHVIFRWAESGSANPWHDVITETVNEAVVEGLIQETKAEGGFLTNFVAPYQMLQPNCRRIRSLRPRFNSVAASWKEFKIEETLLHDQLYDQCRNALIACSECWIV